MKALKLLLCGGSDHHKAHLLPAYSLQHFPVCLVASSVEQIKTGFSACCKMYLLKCWWIACCCSHLSYVFCMQGEAKPWMSDPCSECISLGRVVTSTCNHSSWIEMLWRVFTLRMPEVTSMFVLLKFLCLNLYVVGIQRNISFLS